AREEAGAEDAEGEAGGQARGRERAEALRPQYLSLADELRADTLERFLRYVRVDTQSDHFSETRPGTERQLDLSRLLRDELEGLGLEAVELTEQGYVFATLPGESEAPTVGPLAHGDS